jgi:hypothetical protein
MMAQAKVLPFVAPAEADRLRQRPIDLVHLAKQTLGDSALECEVLRMFDQFATGTFARIEQSTSSDELLSHLSSLRGAAAGVGAWAIADLAETAEAEIAGGTVNPERIDDIEMALNETGAFIAELLENEPA